MPSVLIVSNDLVQRAMGGVGIRSFELARALTAAGMHVTVSAPAPTDLEDLEFEVVGHDESRLRRLAGAAACVIGQGGALEVFSFLRHGPVPLVVDLYDPFVLEGLATAAERGEGDAWREHRDQLHVLEGQLRDGDFFICASERQRDLWVGALSVCGRINPATYGDDPTLRSLIDVVSFGIPDEPPHHRRPVLRGVVPGIGEDDYVLLWGGGLWNWLDPITLVRAVALAAPLLPQLRLFFLGASHPNPAVPRMDVATRTRALSDELGLTGRHVFFNDRWVPYEERGDFLLESDVGVTTHGDHLETQYSFRTRLLDCVWAALPVISTRGDSLSAELADGGMALTVPPGSVEALTAAIVHLSDPAVRGQARRALRTEAPTYRWSRVVAPLSRFCADPRHAPDRGHPGPPVTEPEPSPTPPQGITDRIVDRYRRDGLRGVAEAARRRARDAARRLDR